MRTENGGTAVFSETRRGALATMRGCLVLLGISSQACAGSFTFTELSKRYATHPTGINNDDQVVGWFYAASGEPSHGFVWQNGSFQQVDYPNSTGSTLAGVNDDGLAVGGFYTAQPSAVAFTYDIATGQVQALPHPGKFDVYPIGINAGGVVIGNAPGHAGKYRGVLVTPGSATVLRRGYKATSMNASNAVTGYFADGNSYIFKDATYRLFKAKGSIATFPYFIADDGTVARTYFGGENALDGFTYAAGKTVSFSYPGAISTAVIAIGPSGEVLGNWHSSKTGATHGFVYVGGKYYDISSKDHKETRIGGVNGNGDLIGSFDDGQTLPSTGFIAVCPAAQFPCTQ
jgi:probable HAF family extracellular repeat protein